MIFAIINNNKCALFDALTKKNLRMPAADEESQERKVQLWRVHPRHKHVALSCVIYIALAVAR